MRSTVGSCTVADRLDKPGCIEMTLWALLGTCFGVLIAVFIIAIFVTEDLPMPIECVTNLNGTFCGW